MSEFIDLPVRQMNGGLFVCSWCVDLEELTYLLLTLLLRKDLLLLSHNLGFVFETEGKRKANEECAGGDDPDEVSDDLACSFEETGSA